MKLLPKSLLAAGALALSAFAQGAIVTEWSADVTGVWSSYAPGGVTLSGADKVLSWGVPAAPNTQQSSLTITDPAPSQVVNTYIGGGLPPAAFTVPSISLTHNNRPIFAPFLNTATLTLTLDLTPTQPAAGGTQNIPPVNYDIRFLETTNAAPCTVASPTPCNDIFVLLEGLLNTSFVYDSQTYFVNAFPIAGGVLTTLTDAACTAVGQGSGCLGFTTPENQSSNLAFGLTVSTEPLSVPEPGSVALIGLALGAVALANRRRSVKPEA